MCEAAVGDGETQDLAQLELGDEDEMDRAASSKAKPKVSAPRGLSVST